MVSDENYMDILINQHFKNKGNDPKDITIVDIVHNFVIMASAGMDTTSSMTSVILYCLHFYDNFSKETINEID